ncbi:MAG: O-antigen ligase family protein, partial [Anaerolineae bacterium]|nr:O-antigen ligase family protein [Anaerolineae bacterium]
LGTQLHAKLPVLGGLVDRLPSGVLHFPGIEAAVNANQVGGSLAFVVPLLVALSAYSLCHEYRRWWVLLGTLIVTGIVLLVFVAAQSRASLAGFALALIFMLLFNWRWGRFLLGVGTLASLASAPFLPWKQLLTLVVGNGNALEPLEPVVGSISLTGRMEIWTRAIYGIQDFPFTGMGLGTFRKIVHLLYPLFTIAPDRDLGHAHDFFLQTALDFGLPGLVAVVAIYTVVVIALVREWKCERGKERAWAIGLLGSLIAQTTFSLVDTVAMGARTNFLWWYLMALALAAAIRRPGEAEEGATHASPLRENPL